MTTAHKTCRRRVEFLNFMNDIVAAYPDTALHVVLDNLNTYKPKNDRWLKRHPNVRFHLTPTRASWLNQVEIWFSILKKKSLHGASFTSVKQLRQHIDDFIDAYNKHPKPRAVHSCFRADSRRWSRGTLRQSLTRRRHLAVHFCAMHISAGTAAVW